MSENKIEAYVRKVKNPYDFTVGNIKVHISFLKNGKSLQNAFTDYLRNRTCNFH